MLKLFAMCVCVYKVHWSWSASRMFLRECFTIRTPKSLLCLLIHLLISSLFTAATLSTGFPFVSRDLSANLAWTCWVHCRAASLVPSRQWGLLCSLFICTVTVTNHYFISANSKAVRNCMFADIVIFNRYCVDCIKKVCCIICSS